jgi:hypothetical protein
MFLQRFRVGAIDDLPGAGRFLGCAMGNQDKFAGLEGGKLTLPPAPKI